MKVEFEFEDMLEYNEANVVARFSSAEHIGAFIGVMIARGYTKFQVIMQHDSHIAVYWMKSL